MARFLTCLDDGSEGGTPAQERGLAVTSVGAARRWQGNIFPYIRDVEATTKCSLTLGGLLGIQVIVPV